MSDESDPVLALRIVLDGADERVAAAAADQLKGAGLTVEHVSSRGLLLSGAKSSIEQFLNTRIDFKDKMPQFMREPHFDRLPRATTYRAYFPGKPTYF